MKKSAEKSLTRSASCANIPPVMNTELHNEVARALATFPERRPAIRPRTMSEIKQEVERDCAHARARAMEKVNEAERACNAAGALVACISALSFAGMLACVLA